MGLSVPLSSWGWATLTALEHDVERRRELAVVVGLERADQAVADAEHRVFAQELALDVEHVRDQVLVAVGACPDVGVAGTHPAPVVRLEHVAGWPVGGDRVGHRPHRADLIGAVVVGRVDAAQVELGLDAGLLHRVEPVRRVLPAVERGPSHRFAVLVRDRAADDDTVTLVGVDEHRLALRSVR